MKLKVAKFLEKHLLRDISNTNMVGFIAMLILFISYTGNSLGNQNISYKTSILEYNNHSSDLLVNIGGVNYVLTKK